MKKHLLVYAHYFYPDVASTGQLLTEVCESLTDDFNVTVICVVPSYTGKIKDEYKNNKFYYENYKGMNLIRVRVPEFNKGSKFSRIKNIVVYFLNSIFATFKVKNVDVIFTISQPPVLGGMLGRIGKSIKKCKFIYNIQDFNPEQVEAVGYFKNKFILNVAKVLDNGNIKKADKILLVGTDQFETLENRKREFKEKGILINNWTDDKNIYPLEENSKDILDLKRKYKLDNKFIIMYSGNLGLYYDLENIIKIAKNFKEYKDLVFVFAGEGAIKTKLENYKKKNSLENVYFLPYQPKDKLNISLNMADIHFVVNSKGIKGVSVPSKLYGVMAAGKPVLGVLERGTEARIIIEKSNCGICTEPGNYKEIIDIIKKVHTDDKILKEYGVNSRKYLEQYLSKKVSLDKYKSLINNI
ncbi:glycosyltransferase family 4 protein [Clostridium sp. YIM B02506]|uniref:glycosyltransferase family 4 protein n=1 Tax=Clostridium sp. YIM B02506 TaxID=2910680 RepID=UPI001EED73C5|nr:glycosyltransferase family 4 protein [Clostridium sp. YIM B02506]